MKELSLKINDKEYQCWHEVGHAIACINSGGRVELIELINTNDIHFVITQYNFELLKKIRVLNKQIQIIALQDEINHTHLLESLELKHVKFIQNYVKIIHRRCPENSHTAVDYLLLYSFVA